MFLKVERRTQEEEVLREKGKEKVIKAAGGVCEKEETSQRGTANIREETTSYGGQGQMRTKHNDTYA